MIQIGLKYHSGTFKRDTLGVRVREEGVVKTEALIRVMLLKMGEATNTKEGRGHWNLRNIRGKHCTLYLLNLKFLLQLYLSPVIWMSHFQSHKSINLC